MSVFAGIESGSHVTRTSGGDVVTAISKYMCKPTIATASPKNAIAPHNNGAFPLPLYTHVLLPHVAYMKCESLENIFWTDHVLVLIIFFFYWVSICSNIDNWFILKI